MRISDWSSDVCSSDLAPELAAPQVVRGFAEAVLATQLLDRQPGLGLTQEADDLLFGKALLHVQSPCSGELDSRSRRYSKPGGRRQLGSASCRERVCQYV